MGTSGYKIVIKATVVNSFGPNKPKILIIMYSKYVKSAAVPCFNRDGNIEAKVMN